MTSNPWSERNLQMPDVNSCTQLENARLGLTHVIGLGSACAIHVLERVD
ncbi:MAG: hypothetical protein JRG96_07420 [Deltaproteobacteria bacterium]|nr:hypothetical protein [Deltaproteobacteria bacterium]MBW2421455.1 hypothetical protein [Deltaproteobacteria bacterium]